MTNSPPRARLLSLLAALLLLVGGVVVFQNHLIYFPDNPLRPSMLTDARRDGLAPWPDKDDYRGLLREPTGAARATVVLFHGNAGHAGHRAGYAEILVRFGLRVILAEYPAYGSRTGVTGETALVADATETLTLARRQFSGPLILAGESLGAGVAAATLRLEGTSAEASDVDAVLLITPWDSLSSVASHHYPWLPVRWLLRDRYDSIANLASYRGRVAVVVAEHDSIVPNRFGRQLFDNLAGTKRLWSIAGAEHNDWIDQVDFLWWQSVVDFLLVEENQGNRTGQQDQAHHGQAR